MNGVTLSRLPERVGKEASAQVKTRALLLTFCLSGFFSEGLLNSFSGNREGSPFRMKFRIGIESSIAIVDKSVVAELIYPRAAPTTDTKTPSFTSMGEGKAIAETRNFLDFNV